MANDETRLLEVLRAELEFIEKGGYRNSARAAWRPHFMFQDSPTCLNFDPTQPRKSCSDCALMQLIPEDAQGRKVPCRYIPLNEQGQTIDTFYRTGTQVELEAAVVQWLKATIERLEREDAQTPQTQATPEVHVKAKFV
ncbi:MAG: hypothetical protein JSS69_12110 [Acidobacteria bacterium]|nr:hypothetical protein [Acidobacteriota bacterium]MBS1866649.1 hypothetical protein [Acidobacteriota bacterium]